MPGQAQWPATGIGQDSGGLAVQARTDQAPVVQAGDERVVFQQQGFRPVDIGGADAFHLLEPLIVGVDSAGEGRRGLWCPGHRPHLGRHQQQEGADDDDDQQQTFEGSAHTPTPVAARYFCAMSRNASIDAADSRSMRRLSNKRLAMRIARPLN
ncbi:hypothetical protein D3C81_1232880 [compost metagenome]